MWVFDVVVFLFSFLWVRCVLFKMRVVTNWGTKVLITPRDYRGDRRSVKKYFMMMRSLGPWEIAFLLLKSSRLRKWCIVEFPLIWPVLRPTHGSLQISPLIDIPKGFSSKTTLEVAPRPLEFRVSDSWRSLFFSLFRILPFCQKLKTKLFFKL